MRTLLAFCCALLFATCTPVNATVYTASKGSVILAAAAASADQISCDGAAKMTLVYDLTAGTFTGKVARSIGAGTAYVDVASSSSSADLFEIDILTPNGLYRPELTACAGSCSVTYYWKCVWTKVR